MAKLQLEINVVQTGNGLEVTANGIKQLQTQGKGATSVMDGLGKKIGQLAAGLAGLAAARALGGLVVQGAQFNDMLTRNRLSMAAILSTAGQVYDAQGKQVKGAEALTAATGVAAEMQNRLKILALQTTAEFEDMAKALNIAVAPALRAGFSPTQIVDFTAMATQSFNAIGGDAQRLGQEIRAIFEGEMNPDSELTQMLFSDIPRDKVKQTVAEWKKAGTFYIELEKRMSQFVRAGELNANTLAGAWSNFKDAITQALGEGTQSVTGEMVKLVKELTATIVTFDKENNATFNPEFIQKIKEVGAAFMFVAKLAAKLASYMPTLSRALLGTVGLIGGLFAAQLEIVTKGLGDLMRTITTIVGGVAGFLMAHPVLAAIAFGGGAKDMAEGMSNLASATDGWGKSLAQAEARLKGIKEKGFGMTADAILGAASPAAAIPQGKGGKVAPKPPGPDDKALAKAAAEEEKRLKILADTAEFAGNQLEGLRIKTEQLNEEFENANAARAWRDELAGLETAADVAGVAVERISGQMDAVWQAAEKNPQAGLEQLKTWAESLRAALVTQADTETAIIDAQTNKAIAGARSKLAKFDAEAAKAQQTLKQRSGWSVAQLARLAEAQGEQRLILERGIAAEIATIQTEGEQEQARRRGQLEGDLFNLARDRIEAEIELERRKSAEIDALNRGLFATLKGGLADVFSGNADSAFESMRQGAKRFFDDFVAQTLDKALKPLEERIFGTPDTMGVDANGNPVKIPGKEGSGLMQGVMAGIGGAMQMYDIAQQKLTPGQGAMQMGMAGMSMGAAIGTAVTPVIGTIVGAIIGAVIGAAIGYFTGEEKPGYRVSVRNGHVSVEGLNDAKQRDLDRAVRDINKSIEASYLAARDIVNAFPVAIADRLREMPIRGLNLNDIFKNSRAGDALKEFIQQGIPGAVFDLFAPIFESGMQELGITQDRIDQILGEFDEGDVMALFEQLASYITLVAGLMEEQSRLGLGTWEEMSAAARAKTPDEALAEYNRRAAVIADGFDKLSHDEQISRGQELMELLGERYAYEQQLIQQVQRAWDDTLKSLDDQIFEIGLSQMEQPQQVDALLARQRDLRSQLENATSAEEIQRIVAELQGNATRLYDLMGRTPEAAKQLTDQLTDIRAIADAQFKEIAAAIKARNEELLDTIEDVLALLRAGIEGIFGEPENPLPPPPGQQPAPTPGENPDNPTGPPTKDPVGDATDQFVAATKVGGDGLTAFANETTGATSAISGLAEALRSGLAELQIQVVMDEMAIQVTGDDNMRQVLNNLRAEVTESAKVAAVTVIERRAKSRGRL